MDVQIANVVTTAAIDRAPQCCPGCGAGRMFTRFDTVAGVELTVVYHCGAICDAPCRWTPCLAGWELAAQYRDAVGQAVPA